MYYEEKMIKGVLHYRTTRDGEWKRVSIESLSSRSEELRQVKKNCRYQADRIRTLESAASKLIDLHMCEMEGLSSGQPTPEEWMDAVDALSEALKEQSDGSVIRREG